MNTTAFLSAAVLASLVSAPLLAGQHDEGDRHDSARRQAPVAERSLQDMQTVPTHVSAQEQGHGWQYFSDPATCHAVAISPQGDYYFSRGKGLRWVAADLSGR
ncbi:MAG: hypothetical protein RBS27_04745 [Giesbergeria sp.]|nr:hypothetical protein [Giesbergeria sp.]